MSTILDRGTTVCPHDTSNLHFEVFGGMRIRRSGSDLGIRSPGHFYKARCPVCKGEFLVHADHDPDQNEPKPERKPKCKSTAKRLEVQKAREPGVMLDQMIHLATNLFHGKVDKAGKPYILHCLKVMHYLPDDADEELQCIAIGHDLLEDCFQIIGQGIQLLRDKGFTERVIEGIIALTKREGQDYEDYKLQVKRNSDARKVKMADLRHNSDIRRLKGVTKKDVERTVRYHQFYQELKELGPC